MIRRGSRRVRRGHVSGCALGVMWRWWILERAGAIGGLWLVLRVDQSDVQTNGESTLRKATVSRACTLQKSNML